MRRKGKLFLGFVSIVVTLCITVVADRMLGGYLNTRGYFTLMSPGNTEVYDTEEFTVTARISSQGLRNSPVTIPKPSNTYRIVAFGDSFTFGWGVNEEETWLKLLERSLQKKNKTQIEIINAGAPGLGLDGIVRACQAYVGQFDADAVILGLYGTDDLYQAASWKQNRTWKDALTDFFWPTISRFRQRVIIAPWYNPSDKRDTTIVFSTLWRDFVNNYFVNKPLALSKLDPLLRSLLVRGKVNPSLLRGASQDAEYIVKLLDQKNLDYALRATDDLLHNMKSRCTHNLPVIVVYLPSNETVSADFFPYRQKFGFAVDPRLVTFRPDTNIGDIVAALGWRYVSTLSDFRSPPCTECFYPWDIHMTPKGNQLVAEVLWRTVDTWLPEMH